MRRTKRPLSPAQLAASRANGARSHGPITPQGKARSSQNSLKHGFAASAFAVVRLEGPEELDNLKADLVSVYQPVNSQELFALERMALAQQGILRVARLEAGLFTSCLNETLDPADGRPFIPMAKDLIGDLEIPRDQNRNSCLSEGFLKLAKQSNAWTLFLRYQAQAERQYRRALEEFDRLKALRNELPNEPDFPLQPQPVTTTSPPPEPPRNPPESAPSAAPDPIPASVASARPFLVARRESLRPRPARIPVFR